MSSENQGDEEFQLEVDVTRAGPNPPADDQLAMAASSLLDATTPAAGVKLLRIKLTADSSDEVAQRVVEALNDQLTIIGSTLPEDVEPETSMVEVLVDTEYSSDTLAAELADVTAVEGVVVADIDAHRSEPAAETSSTAQDSLVGNQDSLSIYRLDDHLIVTEDFGAIIERFAEAVDNDEELAALTDDVTTLEEDVTTLEQELESLRVHLETEVPSRQELEYIFAPGAERFDGEGTHSEMKSVIAELDREVGRLYTLQQRGLFTRAWWLLTGQLPGDDSTDQQ